MSEPALEELLASLIAQTSVGTCDDPSLAVEGEVGGERRWSYDELAIEKA